MKKNIDVEENLIYIEEYLNDLKNNLYKIPKYALYTNEHDQDYFKRVDDNIELQRDFLINFVFEDNGNFEIKKIILNNFKTNFVAKIDSLNNLFNQKEGHLVISFNLSFLKNFFKDKNYIINEVTDKYQVFLKNNNKILNQSNNIKINSDPASKIKEEREASYKLENNKVSEKKL